MMAQDQQLILMILFLTLLSSLVVVLEAIHAPPPLLKTYIVQLHPHGQTSSTSNAYNKVEWHRSFLERVVLLSSSTTTQESDHLISSRLLYSYSSAMEGFSALLSDPEVESMRNLGDVIAVRADSRFVLQTTYSYEFLGLSSPPDQGGGNIAWDKSGFGGGTIIGVLDTGVWPESPSFDDRGMPPVPKKWRGACQEGQDFNSSACNRKLIGAKFFIKGHHVAAAAATVQVPSQHINTPPEYVSPRDSSGHGTHTSSTAGGSNVAMVSVLGNGAGEARGMAPGAHIAIYKVCWFSGCYSSDILAAMDVAIQDGVDILSLSLGGFPIPLYDDNIAIGSFRAVEKGVSVVCAAGNNGPIQSSVANEAPWITTVGASTLDRRFPAFVRMGNGKYLYGESMFPGKHLQGAEEAELELVHLISTGGSGDGDHDDDKGSEYCLEGSLPRSRVQGRMVVCDRGVNGRAEKGEVVRKAGGSAMILANTELNLEEDSVDVHVLPATLIGYAESVLLKAYINSTHKPTARILFKGTTIRRSRAPAVARFSSRGPSLTSPSILKPDVIAPGVNIIAAWPQNLGPTGLPEDPRRVNFTVMSGTSMACPHVSGIMALIHSAYPHWSPAAVRSAIMTTADVTDHYGKPIMEAGGKPADVFAMGAGHVSPQKAINPGLIYDIKPDDYITHLCTTLRYTRTQIFTITHKNVSCDEVMKDKRGSASITLLFLWFS
ncbi:hypothetical protein Dimus_035911 [Dionaea muscipula]